jgi:hypothetical protein
MIKSLAPPQPEEWVTPNCTTVQNPILYGARLSGKIDDNWRVGLLNIMPRDEEKI